jgi:hypothetical protein
LFFISVLPAFAETTGNDVLERCQTALHLYDNNTATGGEHMDAGWCSGWVGGTLELSMLHNEWTGFVKEKPTILHFCVPGSGVPVIQGIRVVVKYLKEHPEQLHQDGMGLTVAALKDAFPCKESGRK